MQSDPYWFCCRCARFNEHNYCLGCGDLRGSMRRQFMTERIRPASVTSERPIRPHVGNKPPGRWTN